MHFHRSKVRWPTRDTRIRATDPTPLGWSLEKAALPWRFIWGPNDPVSGAHGLPEIEARLPGVTLHVLDGLGHAPHTEAPDRVNEVLTDLA